MKADASKREFESYLTKRGLSLPTLTLEEGFATFVSFYREVRVADCDDQSDGDMLLAQWGVSDWGRGEMFEFDFTRQFILNGAEDDEIFQLSLTFRFPPTDNLRAFGQDNRWCESPEGLPVFEAYVNALPAFVSVASRRDAQLELRFGCAG